MSTNWDFVQVMELNTALQTFEIETLCNVICKSSITKLDISSSDIGPNNNMLSVLLERLGNLHTLKTLKVSVPDEAAALSLCRLLKMNKSVTCLKVGFSQEASSVLSDYFTSDDCVLCELQVRGRGIESIGRMRFLEKLTLYRPRSADPFKAGLPPKLKHLELSSCELDDECVSLISNWLRENT